MYGVMCVVYGDIPPALINVGDDWPVGKVVAKEWQCSLIAANMACGQREARLKRALDGDKGLWFGIENGRFQLATFLNADTVNYGRFQSHNLVGF